MTIHNFTDLEAWKESQKLVILVYKTTKMFPSDEKFGLTNQIRRASVSIVSNIAEGFGRNSGKDKSQFYAIAKGSLLEVESQLLVAKDLGYLDEKNFNDINNSIRIAIRLISGLIRSAMNK
ncbi:MAG: four helix bundle protein [Candidatus Paceibacterota bacterium]